MYFADKALVTPTRMAWTRPSGKMARSSLVAVLKRNTRPTYLLPMARGTLTRRLSPSTSGQVTISEVSRAAVTPSRGMDPPADLRP